MEPVCGCPWDEYEGDSEEPDSHRYQSTFDKSIDGDCHLGSNKGEFGKKVLLQSHYRRNCLDNINDLAKTHILQKPPNPFPSKLNYFCNQYCDYNSALILSPVVVNEGQD